MPRNRRERRLPDGLAANQVSRLRANSARFGIDYIPMLDRRHGIVMNPMFS